MSSSQRMPSEGNRPVAPTRSFLPRSTLIFNWPFAKRLSVPEMAVPCRVVIVLAFLLYGSSVFAQLGPKDGGNLPPTDVERVKVGQPAPDFTLEDIDGKNISLSDFRGKKTVVLVFYRGYW